MTMGADHPGGKPEPSPTRRRRGFAGALAAFMEERNIFWGELIGGILIVGCSIALVITLFVVALVTVLVLEYHFDAAVELDLAANYDKRLTASARPSAATRILKAPFDLKDAPKHI